VSVPSQRSPMPRSLVYPLRRSTFDALVGRGRDRSVARFFEAPGAYSWNFGAFPSAKPSDQPLRSPNPEGRVGVGSGIFGGGQRITISITGRDGAGSNGSDLSKRFRGFGG
jgi:hypothetical protein